MSFFGFGQSADIDIDLDGSDSRKFVEVKQEDGRKDRYYLYFDGETVSGKVNINLKKSGSRFEHQGIKIEFVGQIELYYDRGNHHEFTSLVKELARPGDLLQNTSYDFEFNQVEKPYESYAGTNVRLRYFLRVSIVRRITDVVREMDLIVHTLSSYPDSNNSIKMEVGIEECLHIEFEYNKSKYHLKDVIVGKIYFLLVRIKIKHMEIAIMKRETTGSGPNTFNENETIAKYEIMDGAPVRGESIPIRVFLAGYDLTPSMRDINKKFSVRYYLNLVLVDEEERRYFKQQEITLWRKGERVRRPLQEQLIAQQQAMQHLHLTSDHIAAQAEKAARQQAEKVGEAVAPLGAEPASPHQSQSPMQEEKPLVAEQTKQSETEKPVLRTLQEEKEPLFTPSKELPKTVDPVPVNNVEVAPASVTPPVASVTPPPASVTPPPASVTPPPASVTPPPVANEVPSAADVPLVTSASPPPLPVTEESSPVEDPSVPPPLPHESSPLEEVESNGIASSPLEDITESKVIDDALNRTTDLPPFVGSCEPPSLPTPPNDSLETPEEEEEEFMEAATSPPADRKEPALAQ